MRQYASQYRDELLGGIIPFWLEHSRDAEYGGYLTSLDRDGTVFDTDKWVWLQGREVWAFATFYNRIEKCGAWLDMALHGAEFLRKYARDDSGAHYFGLTRDGRPLIQPYNIFSDCFCSMGYGALAVALPDSQYGALAKNVFEAILARRDNPKGQYGKAVPGTRPLKSFALPMILCNLALELEFVLGRKHVDSLARNLADEIMRDYYKPEFGCLLENVAPDGSFVDSFEGRICSPGHGLEAMWFLMDVAERLGDGVLLEKAAGITLDILERGWDKEFGGIFYFMDVQGKPPLQLEHDQKLWWVHMEALVACAKGFRLCGTSGLAAWFERIHEYSWKRFRDPEHPEWFGYLNRRGEVMFPFKGGKWKGCFHVPRALFQVWKTLEALSGN